MEPAPGATGCGQRSRLCGRHGQRLVALLGRGRLGRHRPGAEGRGAASGGHQLCLCGGAGGWGRRLGRSRTRCGRREEFGAMDFWEVILLFEKSNYTILCIKFRNAASLCAFSMSTLKTSEKDNNRWSITELKKCGLLLLQLQTLNWRRYCLCKNTLSTHSVRLLSRATQRH